MSEAPILYNLQTIDLSIEDNERLLQETAGKLGETQELIDARNHLRDVENRLRDTQKALRDAEDQVEDLTAKITPLEAKLYGGKMNNPKELSALQEEVELFKKKRSGIEDKVLELMTEVEELQPKARSAHSDYETKEASWRRDQDALQNEMSEIEKRLSELRDERSNVAKSVSTASLQIYEGLRRTRKGKAVAKVEQNTCQGCRVALPANEVQRARTSQQLSFCSTCGRILWVSR